jgi:3-dehydroquinate dehydratase I
MSHPTLLLAPSLRELLQGNEPLIGVSFSDGTPQSDVDAALSQGLDVAEVRIDRFRSFEPSYVVEKVRRFSGLPTIATIRVANEGGSWNGSETARLELFLNVLPEVQGIDIELNASEILTDLIKAAKAQNKIVIISNHNLVETPPATDLRVMALKAKSLGADLVKLSTTAESMEDIQSLASFTIENAELGLIVIAMGPLGGVTRIFFPALGSKLTYAYIEQPPVSGQLVFTDTFDLLRRFYPGFNEKKIRELELLEGA